MKIVFTDNTKHRLRGIKEYYTLRVSSKIAIQIIKEIVEATKSLEFEPLMGQQEELLYHLKLGHRYIIAGNYKILYRIDNESVFITDVFDTRQNPDKIKG